MYVFSQSKDWIHEGWEYDRISNSYLATGSMQLSYYDGPLLPTAGEAPGVSFVLIVLKKYFHSHYFLALSLVQLLVTTATFWLFLHFCSECLPPAAAFWAAILYLVDVNLYSVVRWVNETVYTEFFFVLVVYSFWRVLQSPTLKRGILLGLAAGVGALFRPTFLLVFSVMVASMVSLFVMRRSVSIKTIAASIICFLLVLAPWTMRNYVVFKKFIPVAQYIGINLWNGWAPDSGGTEYQLNGDPVVMEPWLVAKVRAATSETEINDTLKAAAIGYAKQDPMRWLKQRGYAFLFFWHEQTFWAKHSPFRTRKEQMLAIYNLGLLLLFVLSIGPSWKEGGFLRFILFLIFMHSMIYTIVHADIGNRYRLQIEPLLLLVISVGLARWGFPTPKEQTTSLS